MNNYLPLSINTEKEIRQLFVKFKDYMTDKEVYSPKNRNIRVIGAGLFVDFLCGIEPAKKDSGNSYQGYPNKPWPSEKRRRS